MASSSSTYFSSGAGRAVGSTLGATSSGAGSGGVNRETLKGLQDVVWSDDEVSCFGDFIQDGVSEQWYKAVLVEKCSWRRRRKTRRKRLLDHVRRVNMLTSRTTQIVYSAPNPLIYPT